MKYNTVIFDLDGTLIDTLEDLYDSVNHTLQRYGYPLRSLDEVRSFVGNGVEKLMRLSLPNVDEATFYDIFATFKTYYLTHNMVHTKPYVGIMQLLDQLKKRGIKMAIVSNKYHEAVQQICLPLFGSYIEVMLGEQSLIRKKPAPDMVNRALLMLGSDPEHTIYIGDSEVDIQTAHAARTICIGAAWGFRGAPFLKQQGAHYIALTPQDVIPIMHQLNDVVANEKEGTMHHLSWIGTTVHVIVDRPLGSFHPTFHFVYPVPYGYLPHTLAADLEPVDAYLLGFGDVIAATGAVIAVIHRLDDIEDKLVVVPIGTDMTEDEIRKQTYFQEKWFHSVIYMQKNVT